MDNEKLILLVQQNSVFYDCAHPRYNDVNFKNECWRNIGKALNQPGLLHFNEGDDESSANLTEGNAEDVALSEVLEQPALHEEYKKEEDSIRSHFLANSRPTKSQKRHRPSSGYNRRESDSSALTSYILEEKYDPLNSFFSSISSTVRTFSPYHQALAKSKIFAVISEMEINQVQDWEQSSSNRHERGSSPPHPYKIPRVSLSPSSSASEDVDTSFQFSKEGLKDSEETS